MTATSMKMIVPITVSDSNLTSTTLAEDDYAVWSASTVYATGTRVILVSTHKVYESLKGSSSTVTISVASPGVVTWTAHGLATNTPISFVTTGTLPTGIVSGTVYYVHTILDANTFTLSTTAGGADINTTGVSTPTHTATASVNYALSPDVNTSATVASPAWLEVSPTNPWKAFDAQVGTQTTSATGIMTYVFSPGRINSIGFMNMSGITDITVRMTSSGTEIYNQSYSMLSGGIGDWYDYFFTEPVYNSDYVLTDLPMYANCELTITLEGASTIAIGVIAIGTFKSLGIASAGAKPSIKTYSRKETDDFGNITIVSRSYSKRLDVETLIEISGFDSIYNMLALYRDTPVVWIGAGNFSTTLILYGFYRDFSMNIAVANIGYCTLSIEGLI